MSREENAKEKVIRVFQEQLQQYKKYGIEDLSLSALLRRRRGVNIFKQEIDSIEISDSICMGIMVGKDQRWNCSLTEEPNSDSVKKAIEQAIQTNEFVDQDSNFNLSNPVDKKKSHQIDGNLLEISIDEIKEKAIEADDRAWNYSSKVENVAYTSLGSDIMTRIIMNSNGQEAVEENGLFHGAISIAAKGDDGKIANYYSSKSCLQKDDFSVKEFVDRAAEEALSRIDQKPIESKKYKVIFDSKTAAHLLSSFVSIFYGDSLYKKITRLMDQQGELIATEKLNIIDESYSGLIPHYFDGEGTISQKLNIIENGIFKKFLHNIYTSQKTNQENTGHAGMSLGMLPVVSHSNIRWDGEIDSAKNMLEDLEEGILIKELQGASVSAISGDFSYGALGYLIQDGKVICPLADFTVAGNFFDLLKNIISIGDDLQYYFPKSMGSVGGRSLLVKELVISG